MLDCVAGVSRLGILGGTFDPPHFGHLSVASDVRRLLQLDAVLFVVANDPWQKSSAQPVTPVALRLEMVEAALSDSNSLHVCTLEIDRGGPSYMADTLAELRSLLPNTNLFLIIGSEVSTELDTWKRPSEVESQATTVVVARDGREMGHPPSGWRHILVSDPVSAISSTDIRTRCANGRSIDELVPSAVVGIISEHGLYENSL